ncbi:tetratricopeptide repeat-containing sulfotransferase family protein [Hephaestia mangrovi]|uniref:tetratricopeptide repeat-containing sulfotransferase family protein n=1 Tax=Hephaestia mangrovi TaxID=2873268 RepID=UPI001CA643CC|nr:tetratricopeptide repeat-containing sulfotransferase family protein [Hephaestia mangrovi]MBY8828085.1 sulfotransferase [Hephaestia mangrovi]
MASAAADVVIQRIGQAARSGRLDEAAVLAAQARAQNISTPVLSALAGAVEFHRREFARAADYLQDANAHFPNDLVIRANLAEALYHLGRLADARRICELAHAFRDESLRLARLGGFLAQEDGDFDTAIRFYDHVVNKRSDDWEAWNNLGNARRGGDDFDGAVQALERAIELAPEARPVRLNLANGLYELGRIDEAEAVFDGLIADDAYDPAPHLARYTLYRVSGREDEAYAAMRQAARAAPSDAAILSDFGHEAARYNDYADAERAYEAALAIDPALGPPFVGLGSVYERMNREDELDPLRARAEAAGIDAESIAYIDALILKRGGDFAGAYAALERSGDVVVPGRKFHLRGVLLDRLGRHDEAIEAFQAMNDHWRAEPSRPLDRARQYRDMIRNDIESVTPEWAASWTSVDPESPYRTPVFLVGFPRSGTTLLDTMLMAEENTLVLEEEPFIGEIEAELGGTEALPSLDEAAIRRARDSYFVKVATCGPLDADTLVIDKHPMHLNKVPAIRRLFPEARFVLILRHPCDVLLSCFITNFRTNAAMANFLDLGDAAALYDLTFTNWQKAREIFDLPVHTVIYERLVADQHRELAPLFDWLGFASLDAEFDHRHAARSRGTVRTASYSQVTEPVYTRAAGRWRRYRDFLEPVIPTLAPWIDRFGYSLEDESIPAVAPR